MSLQQACERPEVVTLHASALKHHTITIEQVTATLAAELIVNRSVGPMVQGAEA